MEMMMKNAKIAALAATLCLSAAATALAQPGFRPGSSWDSLGTVTVDARRGPWNGPGNGVDRDVRTFD